MKQENRKARVIAFYLPQFHPIPENDKWWGKGFTEWTNVGKAKPLFKGHYQPRVPADLGYYDLRMPEVREVQAKMAREAGIEGFCYWHYWFGNGKQLLERPFNEVLESGKPDFPFCLGWANHSWTTKTWENAKAAYHESTIVEQLYGDDDDYRKHFEYILPAFLDKRYITVDGKPLFYIFSPMRFVKAVGVSGVKHFIDLWRRLAKEKGLPGIYFVASRQSLELENQTVISTLKKELNVNPMAKFQECLDMGFDAINSRGEYLAEYYCRSRWNYIKRKVMRDVFHQFHLTVCKQVDINKHLFTQYDRVENVFPTLIPAFDRSPRAGRKAHIWTGSTPDLFRDQLLNALSLVEDKLPEHRILFLQSWNEWGESNYVEPDLKYGHGFLDILRECLIGNK